MLIRNPPPSGLVQKTLVGTPRKRCLGDIEHRLVLERRLLPQLSSLLPPWPSGAFIQRVSFRVTGCLGIR